MTLLVDHPAWAAVAAVLALAGGVALVAARRSWGWRVAGVALPSLAAVCIALALAGPGISAESRRSAPVVVLLDLSPSTRTAAWRDPAWVRQLARERLGPERPLTIVSLGGRVLAQGLTPAATWPAEWPGVEAAGASLGQAFAWRTGAEHASSTILAPRWLISDGLLAGTPSAAPFPVAVTLIPPRPLDLAVTEAQLRTSPAGELELLVQVHAVGHTREAVRPLLRIARDGVLLFEQPVPMAPDDNGTLNASRWVALRDPGADAAGAHRYDIELKGQADPWTENDSATVLHAPAGDRRILLVGSPEGGLRSVATEVLAPSRLTASAADLAAAGWQTIILADVPAGDLPLSAAGALDRFVRDTGGGLLLPGGANAFGPGGYATPGPAARVLEALSPVSSRPDKGGALHLVLLLDASASMNGAASTGEQKFRLLSRGVAEATQLLAAEDRLTAITFNTAAELLADGPRGQVAAGLRERLGRVAPQGGTAPDAALPLLQSALAGPPAAGGRRLVILVTDGDIPALDVSRWRALLERVPVAIIAPRGEAGPLRRLSDGVGAAWSDAADPAAWGGLLQELVMSRVIGQAHAEPLPWATADAIEPRLAGKAPAWIETWAKPDAVLLAEGRAGERMVPVAAVVQRGLGKAAALPIAVGADASHGALLRQVIDRVSPPAGDRRFTLNLERFPAGGWRLVADAADEGAFLNGLRLHATLLPSEGAPQRVAMAQTAPGRYEAALPQVAPFHVTVHREASGGSTTAPAAPMLVGRLQAPRMETGEWPATVGRALGPGDFPFATVLSPGGEDSRGWHPPLRVTTPLAPALWIVAAVAAVVALLMRR